MRALGFGGHSEEDYDTAPDTTFPLSEDPSDGEENSAPQAGEPRASQPAVDVDRVTLDIFTTVLETFNNALPAFLRDAVDPEAQKKYLFNQLDKSVKEQLARATAIAREQSEASWQQRQAGLRAEVENYKEKLRLTEEKQGAARQAKLSAERQKRALSERVHDLESQVIRLEADAEQTELEKKSLVNKLKVANVHEEDSAALREEISRLKSELLKARAAQVADPEQAGDATPSLSADSAQELESLRAEVASLKESLSLVNEELASTRESLENATEDLRVAEEIQAQLEKFEDVKKRQDSRISSLKKKNIELTRRLEDTQAILDKLRNDKAETEKTLDSGESPSSPADEPDVLPKPVASDETDMQVAVNRTSDALFEVAFDDSAWVNEPAHPSAVAEDPLDFGYKPPKKKSAPPADDATHQLSLW